eukprot:jgi/Picre1/33304/NNA_008628.t1
MSGSISAGDMPVFSEESDRSSVPDRQNNNGQDTNATTSGDGVGNDSAAHVLNELEVALRKTDAVLEPGVLSTLGEYLRQNGNASQAWLRFVEEEDQEEEEGARQLALEKFKPSIFSGIFSSGGSGAPKWLNSLIEDADGRSLIYDLSFRHQNCLLLTFAVQKILMQPGRDEEVASQGVDLSSYFGVFHRILMVRLRAIASTNDTERLKELSRLIQHGAFSNVTGYLHVRQVLTQLEAVSQPWSCRFKRLRRIWRWQAKMVLLVKCLDFSSPPDDASFAASTLIADILATASGGHVAPSSDVIKLYRQYKSRGSGCIPSVKLLHHPMMVEVLLRSLFNPSKRLHGEALEAHAYILAVAVGGRDDCESFDAQKTFVDTKKAISTSIEMAHKATDDVFLTEEERSATEMSLEHASCCASGILMLLRKRILSPDYWNSAYHIHKEPPFLVLLMAINKEQPSMRGDVFHLVKNALQTAGNASQSIDSAIGLVKIMVDLCKTTYIDDVLSWAIPWARNAASELSRELVFGILSIAAPPYSGWFATSMLKLMAVANIRQQAIGTRLWNSKVPLLKEFNDEVQKMHMLVLEKPEANLLRDFRVSFYKLFVKSLIYFKLFHLGSILNMAFSGRMILALACLMAVLSAVAAVPCPHNRNIITCCASARATYKNGKVAKWKCEQCDDGYKLSSNKQQCIQQNQDQCGRGKGLDYFGNCAKCADKNCNTCSQLWTFCNRCKSGYTSDPEGECVPLLL